MAYTGDLNTKILTFLNRAQTKMGKVSTFVAKRLGKRIETYKTELDTAFLLDCFVRSIDNNFNDWTELEINQCIDFWNARANLADLPYFEHESYNLRITLSNYLPSIANSNIDLNGFKIINLASGTSSTDAVNRGQLDTKVSKSGDTMSGDLAMGNHRVTGLNASAINGDAVRHEQLVSEASTRSSADTTLQTNITTEASTRSSADTTLQTNITNEANTRSSADTTLQTNITNEANTRSSADTTLQTNINAKVSKAGDSMTGALAMGTNKITGLADGTISTDAVNKGQLDAVADESTIPWLSMATAGISFSAGWSTTSPTIQVRKVRGVVYFRGRVQKTSTPNNGDNIMVLPVGYRPTQAYFFIALSETSSSNFLTLQFNTIGGVIVSEFGITGSNPITGASAVFDNIQFDVSH